MNRLKAFVLVLAAVVLSACKVVPEVKWMCDNQYPHDEKAYNACVQGAAYFGSLRYKKNQAKTECRAQFGESLYYVFTDYENEATHNASLLNEANRSLRPCLDGVDYAHKYYRAMIERQKVIVVNGMPISVSAP